MLPCYETVGLNLKHDFITYLSLLIYDRITLYSRVHSFRLIFPGHVCHPSPCLHGGHCRVFYGHSKCYCPPLYKGDKCESTF